jgi:hypothetical protein
MTGLVRKAMLLSVCGLLFAGAAFAAVPHAPNCTTPTFIRLVGHTNPADPVGVFTVTVRDLAGNTIENSGVVVDFSGCSDTKLADAQDAPQTVDCPTKTVRALTNASGVATFTIKGAGVTAAFPTGEIGPCATIYADGVNLTTAGVPVALFDLSGDGLTAADRSLWDSDFFNPPAIGYWVRSDFDGSTILTAADRSLWDTAFFSGLQASGGPYCP